MAGAIPLDQPERDAVGEAFFIGGNMITKERAHELFEYQKETGSLISKVRRGRYSKDAPVGYVSHWGYLMVKVDGKTYMNHRIIWIMHHGCFTDSEIDHIDGNSLNNRIENLRNVGRGANEFNKLRRSNNTSGLRGVYFHKQQNKWCAAIQKDGKRKYIGGWNKKEIAVEAYISEFVRHISGDKSYMRLIEPHIAYIENIRASKGEVK